MVIQAVPTPGHRYQGSKVSIAIRLRRTHVAIGMPTLRQCSGLSQVSAQGTAQSAKGFTAFAKGMSAVSGNHQKGMAPRTHSHSHHHTAPLTSSHSDAQPTIRSQPIQPYGQPRTMAQRTTQSLHTPATHYAQWLANYQGTAYTKWLTPWPNAVQWSADGTERLWQRISLASASRTTTR